MARKRAGRSIHAGDKSRALHGSPPQPKRLSDEPHCPLPLSACRSRCQAVPACRLTPERCTPHPPPPPVRPPRRALPVRNIQRAKPSVIQRCRAWTRTRPLSSRGFKSSLQKPGWFLASTKTHASGFPGRGRPVALISIARGQPGRQRLLSALLKSAVMCQVSFSEFSTCAPQGEAMREGLNRLFVRG